MSRIAIYLVACLMALSTVTCMKRTHTSSFSLTNIGSQCRSRGDFEGACLSHNIVNQELTCPNLFCAQRRLNGLYAAVNTGMVNNGTPCGPDRICSNGACLNVGTSSRSLGSWLTQSGLTIAEAVTCFTSSLPSTRYGNPVESHPPVAKRRY